MNLSYFPCEIEELVLFFASYKAGACVLSTQNKELTSELVRSKIVVSLKLTFFVSCA